MTELAISWIDGGLVKIVDLADDSRVVVGRSEDADIVVGDPTVSRQHFAISQSPAGGAHRAELEHLSATNPTRVNGSVTTGHRPLVDGDVIAVGATQMAFHELAKKDRYSGPICHVCKHENDATERDCWFCGTSLLNAPTTIRQPRPVVCRVVSASEAWADVLVGKPVVLYADGRCEQVRNRVPPDAVGVVAQDGGLEIVGSPTTAPNGELVTGSAVSVGDGQFTLICRAARAG